MHPLTKMFPILFRIHFLSLMAMYGDPTCLIPIPGVIPFKLPFAAICPDTWVPFLQITSGRKMKFLFRVYMKILA